MHTISKIEFARVKTEIRKRGGFDPMSCHEFPRMFGIEYMGDCSLENGGTFYSTEEWFENGYVNAVRVDIADGCVFIQTGCINRSPIPEKDTHASACVEIEACLLVNGIESDYNDTNCGFKIHDDLNTPEYFDFGANRIPMDNLQGFVFSKFVVGNVISVE